MSIDQEPNIADNSAPEPLQEAAGLSSSPTSAEQFEKKYPKPEAGQPGPERPDVDEDTLGYN